MESDEDSGDFNETRADLFEAISHPARIRILQTLNEKPMGFAELGRAVGIEGGGHLGFHLRKLTHLVKTTPEGTYPLTGDGKEALWSINALRKSSNGTTTMSREASVMHRNWAKPVLGGLLIALIVLGAFAGFQLQQMGALGSSLAADKDQIANQQSQIATLHDQNATLHNQIASLQSQLENLNSRMSNLAASLLSAYEKNSSVLKVSQTCTAGLFPLGGISLIFTNFGNESVIVPASGVKIIAPNGTQAFPTLGKSIAFYGFPSKSTCDSVFTPIVLQSTVTVPAGGTAWIDIGEPYISNGYYILTFANVITATNQQVSVNPVWINYSCVCG